MTVWESLRIALRALARNKMRTALTMLGMIIGVGAVITLVALGTGAAQRVTASISSLGTNLVTIIPGSPRLRFGGPGAGAGAGPVTTLTEGDAKAVASHFPQAVAAVAPVTRGGVTVKMGDKSYQTSLTGTTADYQRVSNTAVAAGRFIRQADVDGRLKVAVLGTTVVGQVMGDAKANPVGMYVQVNRVPFRVIGVLKTKGSGTFGQDQDDMVLVPVTTALRRVFNRDYLSTINVEAASKDTTDLATEQMSRLLRQRHHLLPPFPDNDDFSIRSQTEMMEVLQTATGTMTSLLGGIAAVSLIVGGIGIMNIMLVSVSERTREIGLRKAVGATSRDILLQFLIESCVIAVVGGMVGVAFGAIGARVMAKVLQTSSFITPHSVLLAVAVAAAIGVFFGIYPAQQAARLDPIDALRYE
jgi:putative ABC transport system permease protein